MEERGVTWRKASRSGPNGDSCIEVATLRTAVMVRDSNDPDGPQLSATPAEWREFVASLR